MKLGGFGRANGGFTIVETLIVLAVTGMLFISVVILVSGRTNKTEFVTAANDLKQQFEQTINEISTGYFPDAGNFTCTGNPGGYMSFTAGAQKQGTNGGCIFLGKAIQFGEPSNPDRMLLYTVAANRLNAAHDEVGTLAEGVPMAVAPDDIHNTGANAPDLTQKLPIQNGLTPYSIKYSGGSTAGFALLSTLGSYSDSSGVSCNGLCSGSQTFQLYAIKNTTLNTTTNLGFADALDVAAAAQYVQVKQIIACFNSGTTNQSVTYTIGSSSGSTQGLAVDEQIQSGTCP